MLLPRLWSQRCTVLVSAVSSLSNAVANMALWCSRQVHGRIKFNHRGQVAMANENKPNTNQSQFFITLGPCDWLDRKHTIFGKVTGNRFYNVARMGDADVDEHDTPTEKFFINSIEILSNPFDDIAPRYIAMRFILCYIVN